MENRFKKLHDMDAVKPFYITKWLMVFDKMKQNTLGKEIQTSDIAAAKAL